MKSNQVNYKVAKLLILAISLGLSSCVSDSLKQIELTTELTSEFQTNSSPIVESDTVLFGVGTSVSILDELNVAFVDTKNISEISPNVIIVRLNEPADSTFAIFDSLWVYLKNDMDSVRIAEFSQETTQDTEELTLRKFNVNVREYLLNSNSMEIALGYSLDSSAIDTVNISLGASFNVLGELE